jgi:hypothetical protein
VSSRSDPVRTARNRCASAGSAHCARRGANWVIPSRSARVAQWRAQRTVRPDLGRSRDDLGLQVRRWIPVEQRELQKGPTCASAT